MEETTSILKKCKFSYLFDLVGTYVISHHVYDRTFCMGNRSQHFDS